MGTLHPSPWGTPWQGLASPDWRTGQDLQNGGATAALQGSIVTPNSQVCYSDSFGFDCAALTAPPPQLTQEAWLGLASAFN